ncbi:MULTISPECIES: hypothetical protein [Pectobacterium]|uniref:hypothetical protein n=1 Tax=Pectobacterium TaxID=122277 RepID=UPI00202D6CF3|nr:MULTISPECIES: hypothetical protein [Pectobacterium]MCL6326492.1 hypothetical protein [Pectobacterium polaris]
MSKDSHFYLKKMVKHIILNDSLIDSIEKSQLLGDILSKNNIGIYSLNEVETTLIERCFAALTENDKNKILKCASKKNIFIVSQPYLSGGHTKLMEHLSSFLDITPDLVISQKTHNDTYIRMQTFFNEIFLCTQSDISDDIERIVEIAKNISNYENIILNIHPDDIHSIIACGLVKKINGQQKIFFVNHADHLFSYGASIADVWFEISSYGKRIDEIRNLSAKKSFIGIPLKNLTLPEDMFFYSEKIKDGDVFLTSGTSYKFNDRDNLSFKSSLAFLMKNYPHSVIYIIGCDIIKDPWWLVEKIKYNNRLRLISQIPHVKYLEIAKKATIYIDSYPIPGATAFPEQFCTSKRCIGQISPLQGYTPAEILKQKNVEDIFSVVFSNDDIRNLVHKLQDVHSIESVKKRFNDAIDNGNFTKNLCDEYIPWSGNLKTLEQNKITDFPKSLRKINYITATCFIQLGMVKITISLLNILFQKTIMKLIKKPIITLLENK